MDLLLDEDGVTVLVNNKAKKNSAIHSSMDTGIRPGGTYDLLVIEVRHDEIGRIVGKGGSNIR